eukprot:5673200-Pleurochrysis_carterae.AAC.1
MLLVQHLTMTMNAVTVQIHYYMYKMSSWISVPTLHIQPPRQAETTVLLFGYLDKYFEGRFGNEKTCFFSRAEFSDGNKIRTL